LSSRFETPVNNFIPGITVSNKEDEEICENPFTLLDKDIGKLDSIIHEPIIIASAYIMEAHNDIRSCKQPCNKHYTPADGCGPTHASASAINVNIELQIPRK
jgi:hypothetical protein